MTDLATIVLPMLGSSALTAAASLGVIQYQEHLRGRGAHKADLARAVQDVLTISQAIVSRATVWSVLGQAYSRPSMSLSVLLRINKPIDLQQSFEAMLIEQRELFNASSRTWIGHDQQTVALANEVCVAAAVLIEALTSPPKMAGDKRQILRAIRGLEPPDRATIDAATKALAQHRKALAEHARAQLKAEAVDVFARSDVAIGTES